MTNTETTLSGLFKEVYPETLVYLMPKNLRFQNDFEFSAGDQRPGNQFHQPVVLQHEHGFTYAAAGAGNYAINAAVPGQIKDAVVKGSNLLLRSGLDYESAARASSGGKRAFVQATQYLVENMWLSTKKRFEISLLYGQMGIGTVSAINTAPADDVITITTAEWAVGIWAGQEGAVIEIFDVTLATNRGTATIKSVDTVARTVTVVGAAPGGVVATDVIFFKDMCDAGPVHNDFAGVHKILSNTGSLFGIDAALYSLWKSNSSVIGGALTFAKVNNMVALAVGKGLDTDLCLYVAPISWANLITDQGAQRSFDQSYSTRRYQIGSENIEFFSQTGKILIKSSIYVKEGYCYLASPDLFQRIGATEITFRLPDRKDEFFLHQPSNAGYELRCIYNQAVFSEAPGKACLGTGVVNT